MQVSHTPAAMAQAEAERLQWHITLIQGKHTICLCIWLSVGVVGSTAIAHEALRGMAELIPGMLTSTWEQDSGDGSGWNALSFDEANNDQWDTVEIHWEVYTGITDGAYMEYGHNARPR